MNLANPGGWTDQVCLRELKLKMSLPVRNWRGQLSKHVQQDSTRLTLEFVKKYLKSRTSKSDRYYTMKQKPNESAMESFYRLNEAGIKAGVRYKKSKKKDCAQHIKRFVKNLKSVQLKAILGNQRFRILEDLEYVLQQDGDLNLNEGYESSSSKRDFRADYVPHERFKRRSGRAYVALSDGEVEPDAEARVRFDDAVKEVQPSHRMRRHRPVTASVKAAQMPQPRVRSPIRICTTRCTVQWRSQVGVRRQQETTNLVGSVVKHLLIAAARTEGNGGVSGWRLSAKCSEMFGGVRRLFGKCSAMFGDCSAAFQDFSATVRLRGLGRSDLRWAH